MELRKIGWTDELESAFAPLASEGVMPARVAVSYGSSVTVWMESGEQKASVAGRLRVKEAMEDDSGVAGLPAVGDWVGVRPAQKVGANALVHCILPRRTAFIRKQAGSETKKQVVAANVDYVFIVSSLNQEFNLRRLERYLTLAQESGARPVLILTKADLAGEQVKTFEQEARALAVGVPVHVTSALVGAGMEELLPYFEGHRTIALLGSSGVGKSTMINSWLGEEVMRTSEVRFDDRGRHTTTHRELLVLPNGGLVIDTPGMRELQLWEGADGLAETFEDIEELAATCRFGNCGHTNEPGCAVQAALKEQTLQESRFASYMRLLTEVREAGTRKLELERASKKGNGKTARGRGR